MGNKQIHELSERFWSHVDKTSSPNGCWIWVGSKNEHGYGHFLLLENINGHTKKRIAKAHRIAWELCRGPIPEGLEICHNCPGGDNPSCVNPDHLWVGAHDQNMADLTAKRTASTKWMDLRDYLRFSYSTF